MKAQFYEGQWHLKGTAEGFPTKLDSIQLGIWITRYGFSSGNDTLCKIKCQKENTLIFDKPLILHAW
jgi:hypothetical protein